MIAPARVAAILLAAGRSTRFGAADKLAAALDGLPLGLHAARTLADLPFAARIAVVGADPPDYARFGFAPVTNDDPAAGQARSIALGVARARAAGAAAVLVALADMPFVPGAHFAALLAGLDGAAGIVASCAEGWSGPPALFGADHFDALGRLEGDRGARALLERAVGVPLASACLADIDTAHDLAAARAGASRRARRRTA